MQTVVGIHSLELHPGIGPVEFESFMTDRVFPISADVPGSVNRGGRSAIRSQHLLKSHLDAGYLWMVKASAAFGPERFSAVFHRMYDDLQGEIGGFASHRSSALLFVGGSFDAGPRDLLGRPIGEPERGQFI
jgi:hypothetical protein